ncbi:MAG: hypothetical protein KAI39_07575, partial [Desulfobulbaceae bacterium]|nr:hypothetical protein [Desulfobulbaceae bacterium]
MNTPAQYRQISVSTIDLTDNRYALNPFFGAEPEALAESIRVLGMLHPPLLLEIDSNSFIVLSGKKRVQIAAQQVGVPLTALVIQNQEKNTGQQLLIFTTLLQHQLIGSSLSIIEQAIFFKKSLECLTAEEVNSLLPLLGYKPKPHIPHQLIALLNLGLSVQQGLHEGFLSQRAGKKLALFTHSDQQTLVALIKELQLGGSKQQQLIDSVLELTKRLHIKAEQLLNRWRDQEKNKNSRSNKPQQAASLLNWL